MGNILHDIFSKHWCTLQQLYLLQIGSQASSKHWIATLQRQIWLIAWKLWFDRNCLHDTDQGNEIQDINRAVIVKYRTVIGNLPSQYAHLFCSTLDYYSYHMTLQQNRIGWQVHGQLGRVTAVYSYIVTQVLGITTYF